jgi:formate-dependent nitrite reductase membrane component NrfD
MTREKSPVFRRAIIPWYDSDRVCWIVVGLMLAIAVFSGIGLSVALDSPAFNNYFWLPLLLLLLSTGIAVSTLIRILRRFVDRISR